MTQISSRCTRVAVVDDHSAFRRTLCRWLEAHGYEAADFDSVLGFIGAGALETSDCLILDIAMPDISGFALKDCIKHANYDIPVIFCTGVELEHKARDELCRDGTVILQKPMKEESLMRAITTACHRSRQNSQWQRHRA